MTAKIFDFPCILMVPFSENQKQKRRDLVQNLHCRVYEQMLSKSEKPIKQKMTLTKDCVENIQLILILTAKYEIPANVITDIHKFNYLM